MLVIKLGGSAGLNYEAFLDDLARVEEPTGLHPRRQRGVGRVSKQLGIEPRHVTSSNGQSSRFTDRETLEVLLMVYAARSTRRWSRACSARRQRGRAERRIDGRIATGRRKPAIRVIEDGKPKMLRGDYAGSIEEIDPTLLTPAARRGLSARPDAARAQHRRRGDQCGRRQTGDRAGGRARRGPVAGLLQHAGPARRREGRKQPGARSISLANMAEAATRWRRGG